MLLTVIMPVYNAAPYLAEALDSILAQTFQDFTILAINDGSTDDSQKILESYSARDNRVIIIQQENRGLVSTLNMALAKAQTPLIARHDADDFSDPQRFEKQVGFLDANPDVGMVGTTFDVLTHGARATEWVPCLHEHIRNHMLYGNCFAHGSIMARTDILRSVGGYVHNESTQYVEDVDLWIRLIKTTRTHNLPDVLYVYRMHEENTSQQNWGAQEKAAQQLCAAFAAWYFDTIPLPVRLMDIWKCRQPDVADTHPVERSVRLRLIMRKTERLARMNGYKVDAFFRSLFGKGAQ